MQEILVDLFVKEAAQSVNQRLRQRLRIGEFEKILGMAIRIMLLKPVNPSQFRARAEFSPRGLTY